MTQLGHTFGRHPDGLSGEPVAPIHGGRGDDNAVVVENHPGECGQAIAKLMVLTNVKGKVAPQLWEGTCDSLILLDHGRVTGCDQVYVVQCYRLDHLGELWGW